MHASALTERYQDTTLTAHKSAVMRWAQFVTAILDDDTLLLFDRHVSQPTALEIRRAEAKVVLFTYWLRQSLQPQSVRNYLSSLWAQHAVWMGGRSLKDLGVEFPAVKLALGMMTKAAPPVARGKQAFTASMLASLTIGTLTAPTLLVMKNVISEEVMESCEGVRRGMQVCPAWSEKGKVGAGT